MSLCLERLARRAGLWDPGDGLHTAPNLDLVRSRAVGALGSAGEDVTIVGPRLVGGGESRTDPNRPSLARRSASRAQHEISAEHTVN